VFHSLLSPIGQYRAANITPSKGKRSKKRKRKENKSKGEEPDLSRPPPPEILSFVVVGLNSITRSLESLSQKSRALKSVDCEKNDAGQDPRSGIENKRSDAGQVPQYLAPEARNEALSISDGHLKDTGQSLQLLASEAKSQKSAAGQTSQSEGSEAKKDALNNAGKPLKNAAQSSRSPLSGAKSKDSNPISQPPSSRARSETTKDLKETLVNDEHVDHHFSAIFVPRSSQPPILHAHLPQLVVTASLANPELPVTRLVQLPKGCDARLSQALGLPRISFIGLLDGAPHSKSLVDIVREYVPEIEIPWLKEAKKSVYMPVKINAIEIFVPVAQKEQKSA
jgi:hypothetical protein